MPSSAGQCRFVRVISVLIFPGAPELCWFCVAQERTGHPRSQRSAEQAFTLDVGRVTVASALGQVSICAYLLLARTHRQPVIDGRSQSVTHGMGVLEQITARNAESALKEYQGVNVAYGAHISHSGAQVLAQPCDRVRSSACALTAGARRNFDVNDRRMVGTATEV